MKKRLIALLMVLVLAAGLIPAAIAEDDTPMASEGYYYVYTENGKNLYVRSTPGGEIVGNRTRAKIVKNKVAPPFKEAEFDILYGKGISKVGEIVDLGVKYNIVKKSGSWFSYGDAKIGQGREAVKDLLTSNKELAAEIEAKINEAIQAEIEERNNPTDKKEAEVPAPQVPATKAGARAKLDIVVDEDE